MMSFGYLLAKIKDAQFEREPYAHIHIADFFSAGQFSEIVSAPEIAIPAVRTDIELFDELFDRGYKIIGFPGCITDRDVYVRWHRSKDRQLRHNNSSCEGFGVTVRLMKRSSSIISELSEFLDGSEFRRCLEDKFGIESSAVYPDSGIQKYLDGYEISPHPDIRQKALTYMVNVNPGSRSETEDHHTHYLKFRREYKYVQAYWEGHPETNRCWVPWGWCESVKVQRQNNSIVIFSPNDSTMHGVKANYSHLEYQRTQLYGNLWYKDMKVEEGPEWEDLVLSRSAVRGDASVVGRIKAAIPAGIKTLIKQKLASGDRHVVADRLKKD